MLLLFIIVHFIHSYHIHLNINLRWMWHGRRRCPSLRALHLHPSLCLHLLFDLDLKCANWLSKNRFLIIKQNLLYSPASGSEFNVVFRNRGTIKFIRELIHWSTNSHVVKIKILTRWFRISVTYGIDNIIFFLLDIFDLLLQIRHSVQYVLPETKQFVDTLIDTIRLKQCPIQFHAINIAALCHIYMIRGLRSLRMIVLCDKHIMSMPWGLRPEFIVVP